MILLKLLEYRFLKIANFSFFIKVICIYIYNYILFGIELKESVETFSHIYIIYDNSVNLNTKFWNIQVLFLGSPLLHFNNRSCINLSCKHSFVKNSMTQKSSSPHGLLISMFRQ